MLGNEPGLVISPNFSSAPLVCLQIRVKGLENRPLDFLEVRGIMEGDGNHSLLGPIRHGTRIEDHWASGHPAATVVHSKVFMKASMSSSVVIVCALTPKGT